MFHNIVPTTRRSRGATLLELAVVTTVFGLLAFAALVMMWMQHALAADATAQSNMADTLTAARSTAVDDQAEYPVDVVAVVAASGLPLDVTAGASTASSQVSLHYINADSIVLVGLSDSGSCWHIYDDIESATYYGLDRRGDTNGCDASSPNIDINTAHPEQYNALLNEIAGYYWDDTTLVDPTVRRMENSC